MRRMGPSQYGATETGLEVGLRVVGSSVGLPGGPDTGPRVVGLEVDVGVVGLRVVGLAVIVGVRVVGLDVGLRVVGSFVVGSLVVGSFVMGSFVVGSLVVGWLLVGSFVGLRDGLMLAFAVGLEGSCFGWRVVGLCVVGSVVVGKRAIVIRNQFMF